MYELKSQAYCVIDIYIFPLPFFLARAKIQGARITVERSQYRSSIRLILLLLWRCEVQKYVRRKLTAANNKLRSVCGMNVCGVIIFKYKTSKQQPFGV